MSTQVFFWTSSGVNTFATTDRFNLISGGGNWTTGTEAAETIIAPCAGTLKNLYAHASNSMGAGTNATFTVRQNGSDTALAVTLLGQSSGNFIDGSSTNSISVSAGDRLSLKYSSTVAATGSAQFYGSIEFVPTNPGDSFHGGGTDATFGAGTFTTQALDGPERTWGNASFTDGTHHSLIATPGNLTALYCRLDNTIVSGSYVFNLVKNGTVQDGSGGTVNTTVTITSQTGNASFTLPVVAGDDIQIQCVVTAPSTARRPMFGVCFNASSLNFNICFSCAIKPSTSSETSPIHPCGTGVSTWPASGSVNRFASSGFSNLQLTAFYLLLDVAPGGGKNYNFQIRTSTDYSTDGGTDQGSTAVTIRNSATTGNSGFSLLTGTARNAFNISATPSGTPAQPRVTFAIEARADTVLNPNQMAIWPQPAPPVFLPHKDFLIAPVTVPSAPVPTQPLVWYPDRVPAAPRGQLPFSAIPLTATLPAPPAVPTVPLAKFPDQIWSSILLGAQFGPFYAGQSLPASNVPPPPLSWAPQVPDQVVRSKLLDGRFGPFFSAHSFPDPTLIPKIWAGSQPTYPARHIYRRPVNTGGHFGVPFVPPAQPVVTLSWLGVYPDQVRRKTLPTSDYPFFFMGQFRLAVPADTTLAWLPTYPDRVLRLQRHPSLEPASVLDPRAGLLPPALSWKGIFAERVDYVFRQPALRQNFAFHPTPVAGPFPPGLGFKSALYPDRIPAKPGLHPSLQQALSRNIFPIPNPTPPAQLSWMPRFPDQIHRPKTPPWMQVTQKPTQFEVTQAALELRWWPRYPDQLLRPWRPILLPYDSREPILVPGTVIASTIWWQPVYPVAILRGRIILTDVEVGPVVVPAMRGNPICIEIEDELDGTPDFTPEFAGVSTLTDEFGGEADMDTEISCGPTEVR